MIKTSNKTTDYCLGKLNENGTEFTCSSRSLTTANEDTNNFGYPVMKDGTYAVLFNP